MYRDTKTRAIRNHLELGMTLTPMECMFQYRTHRLASAIHELRKQGYVIKTELKLGLDGDPYAEYKMTHRPSGRAL